MTGLPEPRANPRLLGHLAAEATLRQSVRAGRMHHAWLVTGAAGIGKATLAYRFARWLLAGAPDTADGSLALEPTAPAFRRVAAGTHADLLTVERAYDEKRRRLRTEIVVDDVREVAGFLRLTPAEGGWRGVVLDGADAMNRNAANAILKVLEEPPPRAVLLLVCETPGRLLPTLRSRCRALRLSPPGDAVVDELLADAAPELSADDRTRLAGLANGSPGRAITLARDEGVAIADLVRDVLAALPDAGVERAHMVADALGRSDAAFSTFMDLLRASLARAVTAAGRDAPDRARQLGHLAALRPLADWCDVWHALGRLQDETERFYLDKRQAIVAGLTLLRPGSSPS